MSYADKPMTCRDCGQAFVFSSGEQEFFAQKGFTNEPSRCPECRSARKASGGGGGGGYSSGGGYSGGGGYGRQEREHRCSGSRTSPEAADSAGHTSHDRAHYHDQRGEDTLRGACNARSTTQFPCLSRVRGR